MHFLELHLDGDPLTPVLSCILMFGLSIICFVRKPILCLHTQIIVFFLPFQEKVTIPILLLTWLMKKNIPLIFPFTCSHAYSINIRNLSDVCPMASPVDIQVCHNIQKQVCLSFCPEMWAYISTPALQIVVQLVCVQCTELTLNRQKVV